MNVADERDELERGVHVDELNFSRIAQILERARTDKRVDSAFKLCWKLCCSL